MTSEDEAIDIANDTVYGLAAYVQSKDIAHAGAVAAADCAPARSISTIPIGTRTRPSAATSNPATGANMPISASTTSSRSRASSATARPEGAPTLPQVDGAAAFGARRVLCGARTTGAGGSGSNTAWTGFGTCSSVAPVAASTPYNYIKRLLKLQRLCAPARQADEAAKSNVHRIFAKKATASRAAPGRFRRRRDRSLAVEPGCEVGDHQIGHRLTRVTRGGADMGQQHGVVERQ